MRVPYAPLVGVLLLTLAFTQPCKAIDWSTFDDPTAILLTDQFAKSIDELSAPEKTTATKRLLESLESKMVEIQRRAALTLHSLGDNRGVPTMIGAFSAATGRDRDHVVVALRILKDKRAIPVLRKALKDESPYVRSIAVASLGELKATKAYDEIVLITKDKGVDDGQDDGTLNCMPIVPARSACYALGALGDQRAIAVLIKLLDDKDLQWSAIQALEVLTKQKFGNDPAEWKSWWKTQS